MIDLVQLCDAVSADIDANVSLPEYVPWAYVPPDVLTAEHAPWLAVFPVRERLTPVTTDPEAESVDYEGDVTLMVEWAEALVPLDDAEAQQNLVVGHDALINARAIGGRLLTYGAGIPGFTSLSLVEGGDINVTYETNEAGVWKAMFDFGVKHYPANG